MKKDVRLDYIRTIAIFLIFLCHFFQVRDNLTLAFWFNCGVQAFIILSARLSAKNSFSSFYDALCYFRRRFSKIFIPLWIYLFAIIAVLLAVGEAVDFTAVIFFAIGGAGFSKKSILGLGHLWYITVQLICYLLVPFLYLIYSKFKVATRAAFAASLLAAFALLIALFYALGYTEYGVNISLFCFSYFFFKYREEDGYTVKRKSFISILAVALILCTVRAFLDITDAIGDGCYFYESVFCTLANSALAMLIFCSVTLLPCIGENSKNGLIGYISERSYEVYLSHQFIILSVYKFIPYCNEPTPTSWLLMLLISLCLTALNSEVLFRLSSLIRNRLIYKKQGTRERGEDL